MKNHGDEMAIHFMTLGVATLCQCRQDTPLYPKIIKILEKYQDDKNPVDLDYWEELAVLVDSTIPENLPEFWHRSLISVLFLLPLEMVEEYANQNKLKEILPIKGGRYVYNY